LEAIGSNTSKREGRNFTPQNGHVAEPWARLGELAPK